MQSSPDPGNHGAQLLAEAGEALRQPLLVWNREQFPRDWAGAQCNLGNALRAQGRRTSGERAPQLLAEAIEAYHQALLVITREQFPRDWAKVLFNLGSALLEQGVRTDG